jgi:hypothetical protein
MDGPCFDRAVLNRLPLAEAVLVLMRFVLNTGILETSYEDNRGRCHNRLLSFPAFVHLLFDCLSHHRNSARATLVKAKDEGRLPVSLKSFYDKLKNTPCAVSINLFSAAAKRLRAVVGDYRPGCPTSLQHLTTLLMDGKVIKHVSRRLKPLRLDRVNACKLLGPRTLVLAERWTGLLYEFVADPDGEANEVKYVSWLLERLIVTVKGPWLIVGDRAFGVFKVCQQIQTQGGHFLMRMHGATQFIADPNRPKVHSRDRFGRLVVETWGWIVRGQETKNQKRPQVAVRQVTVQRDTTQLVLITNLIDAEAYPTDDLLDAYLARWDIEGIFQQVTEVFHLRSLFTSSPCGMLFQLVITFLMFNVVQTIKLVIAQEQNREEKRISTEMLFRDIVEETIAATKLLPESALLEQIPEYATASEARTRVETLLKGCWQNRWLKANYRPRDPSKPPDPKPTKIHQRKAHDSVHRILERQAK